MAEHPRKREQQEKKKLTLANLCLDTVKNAAKMVSSTPSSPVVLRKSSSGKVNCLCSPTTHAGSFRCRYHRNNGLSRSSMSVGSKLSEFVGKQTGMCGTLHAQ